MRKFIKIDDKDNVVVAVSPIEKGEIIDVEKKIAAASAIPQGHKISIQFIKEGESVIKYGQPIGTAIFDISPGEHVHTSNVKTGLSGICQYTYTPKITPLPSLEPKTFMGFQRKNGQVGIRNEIWIIPTVGCVNSIAKNLEKKAAKLVKGSLNGIYSFPHSYGCSQLGEDLLNTQKVLAGLANHPNAAGVLVLGLGCESNNIMEFKKVLGEYDEERVKFLCCQESDDELADALSILEKLAQTASQYKREPVDTSKLIVGLKCGGSDGFSGITANPAVGVFSDMLICRGGTTILTEVPEMFGAEILLMNRCKDQETFEKTITLINNFKDYFMRHGQEIYKNPSPGNKEGGISTLEDKSLGCTQKSGTSPVMDVLSYGDRVCTKGLNLLNAPGNDLVATTALAVSGAHIVLFTTGRGTPFACPVPTVKISSNHTLYQKKKHWIDFNAGEIAQGEDISAVARKLFDYVIALVSGEITTKSEDSCAKEIAIFKQGVTL